MSDTGAQRSPAYDAIGAGYSLVRRADHRIEQRLHAALGSAARVLNVGAGAGSYEPTDRVVVAVEPSRAMLEQRTVGSSALQGVAEALPFPDGSFDGAMAVLTVHHWVDPIVGLTELRRVTTGPIAVFSFDKDVHDTQWLIADYLPGIAALDPHHPSSAAIAAALGGGSVEVVAVPHDCEDGFCHAWWRRPAAYLDPAVRAGISGIARLPRRAVDRAMARLARDLADGSWRRAHQDIVERDELDAGYRLIVSPGPASFSEPLAPPGGVRGSL